MYAGFKYLLPLVAPFFVGYILALLLRPSARFLSYRMRITVKGKRYHMPIGVIGGVEFLAVLSVLGGGALQRRPEAVRRGKTAYGAASGVAGTV